jgi:hypothetical protein
MWHEANEGRMPLTMEFLTDYDIATASIHAKNTWTLGPFVDPGHRRDIDPDPMWQLKANDGTEFVIKSTSSTLPNWYMEVGALQDPTQTGYLSLMLKASNAQTTNATGIKWTVLYEHQTTPVALDQYTFTNVADPTVILGIQNVFRVGGLSPMEKSLMTDAKYGKMLLTGSTGTDTYIIQNEGYQLQTTQWNLYGVHTNGVYETLPMTMYDTVQNMTDTSTYEFEIRPYNSTLDSASSTSGVLQVDAVNM